MFFMLKCFHLTCADTATLRTEVGKHVSAGRKTLKVVSVSLERKQADQVIQLFKRWRGCGYGLLVRFCCGKFNHSFDNRRVKRSRDAIAQRL